MLRPLPFAEASMLRGVPRGVNRQDLGVQVGATERRLHLDRGLARYGRSVVLHGAEMDAPRWWEELCRSELWPSCTNRQPAIAEVL